jgi:hypothetical protein
MSASDSVSLYLAFPKILVAGFGSFFRATLVNRESTTLENVAVTFACADFDPPEIVLDFDAVAPGARVDKTISITPARPGSRPLACAVEFSLGSDSKSLFGSWEHLTIFEKPSNEINITNIVRDVQSHRSSGEKAEFGAVKGDVSINLTNNLTQIRTLNELLAANMPDELHQVHLRSLTTTEFSSSSNRRRIPSAFLRVYEPMAALSLRPLGAPPPDPRAPAVCGWRLRGGGTPLVLGRSSVDVDMVTRFMPADAANDSKSAGLSRRQARLSVNGSGQVQVENVSSGNVVIFTWGHALFDWQNSAPSYWNTVWFSRLAAFGSAEDVPLRLDDPGIDPCHGFLHYFNGCYWLEVISPRGGVTLHDPQIPLASPPLPIPPGVIVPLRGNMTLTVGSTSYLLTKAA